MRTFLKNKLNNPLNIVLICLLLPVLLLTPVKTSAFSGITDQVKDDIYTSAFYNNMYSVLEEMEAYYYNKKYKRDKLSKRISRLEYTIFNEKHDNLPNSIRYMEIYNYYTSLKSPFHKVMQDEDHLLSRELLMLNLIEERTFGNSKENYPLETRITKLEKAIFGNNRYGSIEDRFNYLTEKVPIATKGIRLVSTTKGTIPKGIKRPPVPQQSAFTPLNATYNPHYGNYFQSISTNSSGEVLRWKDFPIYIFINATSQEEKDVSVAGISSWRAYVPMAITSELDDASILIDWASASNHVTVPILVKKNDKKAIKVVINLKNKKEAVGQDELTKFLSHQLGHALGIWGHSTNPEDLMFPHNSHYENDINIKQKHPSLNLAPIKIGEKSTSPSAQDLNTLLKVYQTRTSLVKYLENLK